MVRNTRVTRACGVARDDARAATLIGARDCAARKMDLRRALAREPT